MLSERPVLGTGPGNFRQHYLKHKAAESSEEIRDPHNLILDVWANGGLLALAGLLMLIGFGMQRMLKEAGNTTETIETASLDQRNSNSSLSRVGLPSAVWSLGALSGMLLVILKGSLLDQGMDEQILTLMIGVSITLLCIFRGFQTTNISTSCLMGTWFLLLVHLLGAGGMEMPAIIQIILVLPILVSCPARSEIATDSKVKQKATSQRASKIVSPLPTPTEKFTGVIGLTLTATLAGLCLITSLIPVQMRQWYLAAGNYEWGVTRKISAATGFFQEAAIADPLSPEPSSRLAGVAYQRWRRGGRNDRDYQQAVERQQDAIHRDPNNFSGYVVLGEWQAEHFSLTENRADALAAVESFQQALRRYPNHSHIVAKLAVLLNKMEHPPVNANETAKKAIELDEINREEGHRDRVFEGKLRKILEEISVSPAR